MVIRPPCKPGVIDIQLVSLCTVEQVGVPGVPALTANIIHTTTTVIRAMATLITSITIS